MSIEGKKRLVDDWFRFAGEDLAAAQELAGRGSFHHQACLLSQQSAEKYLKIFLLSKGWKLVRTHELSQLAGEYCSYDDSFQTVYPHCEILNKYIIAGRYPGDLPFENTTAEDANQAVTAAIAIEFFVVGKRESFT